MARRARIAPGGCIYHVLNRANGLGTLFDSAPSYREFLRLVAAAADTDGMRVLAFCLMPNHWHMLLWPRSDGDLFRFIHRLTIRHTQRFHARHGTAGRGHLYQARYKSFVVQDDAHLLTVCRYIERNPVRAKLAATATAWPWSSAAERTRDEASATRALVELEPFPIDLPANWPEMIDEPEPETELEKMRTHVTKSAPFGSRPWKAAIAERADRPLEAPRRGRPRQQKTGTGPN